MTAATRAALAVVILVAPSCAASGYSSTSDDPALPPAREDAAADGPGDASDANDAASGDVVHAPPPCDLAKPFDAPVAIAELDTVDQESVADLSPDELTLYFASNHGVSGMHLFDATRASVTAPWGPRTALFPSGAFDDWNVAVTADGLTAIVSSDRGGNDDLYVATRSSTLAGFGALGPVAGTNTASNEATPRWSADGKTLYFDSDRGGNRDIYRVAVTGSSFGAPARVDELASSALDAAPVLSADELTIYFLSTRAPTADGDIWTATRPTRSAPFGALQPLPNVNGPAIDAPARLSTDGCTLYISSTRNGGTYDMFVARRPRS